MIAFTLIHATEASPPYSVTLDQSGAGNSFSSEAAPYLNIPLGTFPIRWVNFNGTTPYQDSSSVTEAAEFQNFVTPLVYSWNANIQYQFAPTWMLEVAYVGARGIHQAVLTEIISEALLATPTNPVNGLTTSTVNNAPLRVPYLGLSPTGAQDAMTNGDYKSSGLQVTARKQLSHGLTLQAAYSWTRAFASTYTSGDPLNSAQQYGLNPGYRPQRLVINYTYNLPGSGMQGLAGAVLGGWSLSV
jgi:hypothetical protein